jgi:hypothetical protein
LKVLWSIYILFNFGTKVASCLEYSIEEQSAAHHLLMLIINVGTVTYFHQKQIHMNIEIILAPLVGNPTNVVVEPKMFALNSLDFCV